MRGARYLIVVVGLLGCGRESERTTGADPAAIERCARAMDACADLYRGRACAASWRTLYDGKTSRSAAIAGAILTCRGDYCDRLRPRPRACDEGDGNARHLSRLDEAILVFEGVERSLAARLAERLTPITVALPDQPPAPPPRRGGTLELVVDATGRVLYNRRPMEPLALDRLLADLPDDTQVFLRVDKDTQYAQIVALMDKIRATGIKDIVFSTR